MTPATRTLPSAKKVKVCLIATTMSSLLVMTACGGDGGSEGASAEQYPAQGHQLTMIVPFSAGGSTDVSARTIADAMEDSLGVPIQIENRPGAATQIGMTALANSPADGYTIAYTAIPSMSGSYLDPESEATYERDDFDIVARTTVDPIALSVLDDSPFRTLDDLIQAAKEKPGDITVALGGVLGVNHLNLRLLEQLADVQFAGVQFEGGAPALNALLGGHTDVGTNASSELRSHVEAGTVRILALFDSEASDFFPDAETAQENGFDVAVPSSHVIMVPAGTPEVAVEQLSNAASEAASSEDAVSKLQDLGLQMRYLGPEDAADFWLSIDDQLEGVYADFREDQR